jgi:hypothetical protein
MISLLRYCLVLTVAGVAPLFALRADDKKEEKKGAVVEINGLKSATPADWKQEEVSSQFRVYHFRIPHVADDKTDAELIIFFFGTGGGGPADANVKRWKGFFIPPEGKKIDDVAKVESFKVGDVNVTYLEVEGTYKFQGTAVRPVLQGRITSRLSPARRRLPKSKRPVLFPPGRPDQDGHAQQKGIRGLGEGVQITC